MQDLINAAFPPALPPVLGVDELSKLIKKSPASIIADRSRAPYRLPPSCEPPKSRQPLWLLSDVLDWLRHYQRPSVPPPAAFAQPRSADTLHRRGRPTKVEQTEANKLDISVRELRERSGEGAQK